MSVPFDTPIPVGQRHRTLCHVVMLLYDADGRTFQDSVLPAESIFQPWEPRPHWRGQKVPITLGGMHSEFDCGESSEGGLFLQWEDFFSKCEPEGSQPTDIAKRLTTSSVRPTQDLFYRDARGRTQLFYIAESGLMQEVKKMIFSLRGTASFPPRLGLIKIKDNGGLTAADVAEQNGHHEIAELLRREKIRMEYFE